MSSLTNYITQSIFRGIVPGRFMHFHNFSALKKMQNFLFTYQDLNRKIPIAITSYHWPDLDGISCIYGLSHLMKEKGFEVVLPMIAETPQDEALWAMQRYGVEIPKVENWLPAKKGTEQVILVDTSDPQDLPSRFPISQVRAIIDHRMHGDTRAFPSHCEWIEPVGAAATLITELYLAESCPVPPICAQLLHGAIESNTIRCSTTNTTDRDREAVGYLKSCYADSSDWILEMFLAKSNLTGSRLYKRLEEDLSSKLHQFDGLATSVAQLEIANVEQLLAQRQDEILQCLSKLKISRNAEQIFLVVIDLFSDRTFFIFGSEKIKSIVSKKILLSNSPTCSSVSYRFTRKEIIRCLSS